MVKKFTSPEQAASAPLEQVTEHLKSFIGDFNNNELPYRERYDALRSFLNYQRVRGDIPNDLITSAELRDKKKEVTIGFITDSFNTALQATGNDRIMAVDDCRPFLNQVNPGEIIVGSRELNEETLDSLRVRGLLEAVKIKYETKVKDKYPFRAGNQPSPDEIKQYDRALASMFGNLHSANSTINFSKGDMSMFQAPNAIKDMAGFTIEEVIALTKEFKKTKVKYYLDICRQSMRSNKKCDPAMVEHLEEAQQDAYLSWEDVGSSSEEFESFRNSLVL